MILSFPIEANLTKANVLNGLKLATRRFLSMWVILNGLPKRSHCSILHGSDYPREIEDLALIDE